jgi:hypothetical protein
MRLDVGLTQALEQPDGEDRSAGAGDADNQTTRWRGHGSSLSVSRRRPGVNGARRTLRT